MTDGRLNARVKCDVSENLTFKANAQGIMSSQLSSLLFLVVGVSMAITPWLAGGGQMIASRFEQHDVRSLLPVESETDDLQDHIIICRFGRVGQIIAQLLSERLIPFVTLDVRSGDQDSVIPLIGSRTLVQKLARQLGLNTTVPYRVWFEGQQVFFTGMKAGFSGLEVADLGSKANKDKLIGRGQDIEGLDVLRQGFTYAFLMTFNKKEDYVAFQSHPDHVEFSATFSAAIDRIVLPDFPSTLVKAPAPVTATATS